MPVIKKYGADMDIHLTPEELGMVAYPAPEITIFADTSGHSWNKAPKTFKAPGGKQFFTVQDLAETLAKYELAGSPPPATFSDVARFFGTNHVFFEGLHNVTAKDGTTGVCPFYGS